MFTLLLTVGLALAQSVGDFRYLTTEAKLLRYADAKEVSATVKQGTKVEVVAVGGALVRVRAGRDFGWVEPGILSETAPEPK